MTTQKPVNNPYAKIHAKTQGRLTEILLIRHCHPDYKIGKKIGDRKMPLSKEGLKQRTYLNKRLLKTSINKVYCSELERAKQTAEVFAKKKKLDLIVSKRINEFHWEHWYPVKFFNMGEQERKKRLLKYKVLDAELDFMQVEARRSISKIYKESKGKKVAVFSHGNFIKSLLTGILNADIIGFLSMEIFQSSISKIVIDEQGYIKIAYINSIFHLPEPPKKDLFITLSKYEDK